MEQTFLIEELIIDIQSLLHRGLSSIEPWAYDPDLSDLRSAEGQRQFTRALHEDYRRSQLAYSEIADHSFPTLRRYLRTLRLMPLKYEIEVEFHARREFEDVTLHYRRLPVATYGEAGADVIFPETVSDFHSKEAVREYINKTDSLLAEFGRTFAARSVQWGGTQMPDWHGRDTAFDGLRDESTVVRRAMKWLKDDIDALFAEVPSYRLDGN